MALYAETPVLTIIQAAACLLEHYGPNLLVLIDCIKGGKGSRFPCIRLAPTYSYEVERSALSSIMMMSACIVASESRDSFLVLVL